MARKSLLYIDQGATFEKTIQALWANGDVMDLTSYVATGTMRRNPESANTVAFTCNTTADGLDYGDIVLSLTAEETANIELGRYLYEVHVTDDDIVYRVSEGLITVG